jgi:tetratricopeptide (TPR) repeat protein
MRHDPGRALRLAVHMWPMWMAGSHFGEGRRRLEAVLDAAPEPTELRAEALRALCGLEMRLGRTSALPALGAERLAIYRALGDQAAVAHALDEDGVYAYMTGDYDRADRLYAESRALAARLGDGRVAAAVEHSLGVLAHCRGDFEGAREAFLTSLGALRRLPAEDAGQFFRVHTVGLFVAGEGPGGAPRMYFEETAQFFRRVDARRAIGYVLAGLGDVCRAQGMGEPARERLAESLAHFREAHDPMGVAFALNRLGILAGVTGQHELGREWLEEALALRRELGDRRGVGMTIGNLGVLAARAGDPGRGRAVVAEALEEFEDTDDAPGRMGLRLNLGNLAADAGELGRARGLYEESIRLAEAQRLLRAAAWTGVTLAELALAEGDASGASRLLETALARMRALGDRWGVARALELGQAAAKTPLSPARER